jgi:predicted MFS family arabinose efflux permease
MPVVATQLLGVCTDFIGFLFLSSSVLKWMALDRFTQSLLLVPYLPHRLARPIGVLLPAAEALTALLLIVRSGWGTFLAVSMLLLFAAVAVVAHRTKQAVPCNCFGGEATEFLSLKTAVRNLCLAAVAALGALAADRPSVLDAIYGLIALLMFAAIVSSASNHREYLRSFGAPLR